VQDIVLALRRYLVSQPSVVAVLGGDALTPVWVFQDKLQTRIEGTSSVAMVVSQTGGWAAPMDSSKFAMPRITVEYYADPQRDANHAVTVQDARHKIYAAHDAVDEFLHSTDSREQYWDTLRIVSTSRLAEPIYAPWGDTDGAMQAQVQYGVVLG
jgi:hypothetical protein